MHHGSPTTQQTSPPRRPRKRWPLSAFVTLLVAMTPAVTTADEVHWLDEDRYLLRFKERRPEDVDGSVDRARSKAAALCLIAGRQVAQIDEPKFRVRLRAEQKDVSIDVLLLDEVPAEEAADRVSFSCSGRASQKDLELIRKALRKSNIVPKG